MSTENTQDAGAAGGISVDSASSSGAEVVSTPAANPAAAASDALAAAPAKVVTEGAAGQVPGVPVVPAYTPNYKYKAALLEKELDPMFRDLIKDADSEKKVKDVFTRADAFDYMKEKFATREKEFQTLNNDFQSQGALVSRVREAQAKKDYDSVFRNMGVNEHDVIRWAAKRVDYLQQLNNMPPEQREAIQRSEQAAQQNETFQTQIHEMQSELMSSKVQARTMHLEMQLSRPEVATAASFWDSKMGQQGAFRDLVIEEAQKEWHLNKVDLSSEQAVSRVLAKFGKFIEAGGSPQAPPAAVSTAPQMPGAKPVIPIVPGSSKTPIRKAIKSLDDIKQRSKELENQDGY